MINLLEILDVEFNFRKCSFTILYNLSVRYAEYLKIDSNRIIFTLKSKIDSIIIKSYSEETDKLFDEFDYIEWYKTHSNTSQTNYNFMEQNIKDKIVGNFKFERFRSNINKVIKCVCDIDILILKGCVCKI